LYRGINEFKKGYQPRAKMVKAENGDLLADSHSVLNRWKNYFCQLLNVHGVNDVRQTEIHTKIAVFWVVAPCSLVEVYQRFRGPCCLHHQGDE
jgi:hypothetical protein